MVAAAGSTPPRAARCMSSIHAWAASGVSVDLETDRRCLVLGSIHRARARYGFGRSARTSTSQEMVTPTGGRCAVLTRRLPVHTVPGEPGAYVVDVVLGDPLRQ